MRISDYISVTLWGLGFILLVSGCVKEPKGAPEWDIELNIPLLSDTLALHEVIVDSLLGEMDTLIDTLSDTLILRATREFEPRYLRDSLRVEDASDSVVLTLSSFTLVGHRYSRTRFSIPELLPDSISQSIPDTGIYMPIPYFRDTTSKIDTLENVRHISLTDGKLSLTIKSYLSFTIDTLLVSVVNKVTNREIISVELIELQGHGDSAYFFFPLRNIDVDSIVGVYLDLTVLGTPPGSFVRVNPYDSLVVEFTVDSVRVSSATIIGGELHGTSAETTVVEVGHGILLDTLELDSGMLRLEMFNTFSTGIELSTIINELGFDTTVFIPANGGRIDINFDLANFRYVRLGPENTISGYVTVGFRLPDTSWITLSYHDTLLVAYHLEDLELKRAVLTIDTPIVQEVEPQSVELPDIPEFADSLGLRFREALMEVDVVSGVGIPVDFELSIQSPEWDTVYQAVVQPGTPFQPETTKMFLNLTTLVNTHPESVTVWGRGSVYGHGEIWADAFVGGQFRFALPMIVQWDSITIKHESAIDIDDSTRSDIRDAPEVDGRLLLFVHNSLPFAFDSLRLTLIDTSASSGTRRDSVLIRISGIPFPRMSNGVVIGDTTARLTLGLTNEQLKFLADADLIRSELFVPPSGDGIVLMRRSDFYRLSFNGILNVKLRIDPEELGGD